MLKIIYTIIAIINFLIILFTAKKLNFVIIYYFSSLIYYFNGFIGEIYTRGSNGTIESYAMNEKTYWILIINMLVIFIMLIIDFIKKRNVQDNEKENNCEATEKEEIRKGSRKYKKELVEKCIIYTGTIISVLGIIYIVYSLRDLLFTNNYNKTIIMEKTSRLQEYYKMFTMFWTIYLVIQHEKVKSKLVWIVAFLGLALTFLLGHRSFLVIAIIAVAIYIINEKLWKKGNMLQFIACHKKILILALIFVFVVFFIKGVYTALFNRDFDLVWSRLTDISYYTNTLKISEPNVIMANLNGIVDADYKLDFCSYAVLPTYLIPGLTNLLDIESFTKVYQEDLFGSTNRASTILGEAYANGGLLVVIMVAFILNSVLLMVSCFYEKSNNNIWKAFLLLTGTDIAFFIHRNSADYAICRIRYFLYFVVVLFAIKMIANVILDKKRSIQQ